MCIGSLCVVDVVWIRKYGGLNALLLLTPRACAAPDAHDTYIPAFPDRFDPEERVMPRLNR